MEFGEIIMILMLKKLGGVKLMNFSIVLYRLYVIAILRQ
jgi:hypothetical protein